MIRTLVGLMSENIRNQAALEMHKLLLEALRHREQEIFRYLAILGPALGGFVWLLYKGDSLVWGAIMTSALLLLGAIYSLALGYNYRYIVFELAKLEKVLNIEQDMLQGWPKTKEDFLRYKTNLFGRERFWCEPPEVIKVFWYAFLIGIEIVTIIACWFTLGLWTQTFIGIVGYMFFLIACLLPIYYGNKLQDVCEEEKPVETTTKTDNKSPRPDKVEK
jgi:hypothetical protein